MQAFPPPDFGALLLAGGKGRRMGQDKARLDFRGVPLLDHMQALLTHAGARPVLVSGRPDGVADLVAGAGPVAGVCALGRAVADDRDLPEPWLIVAVDMPLLTPGLLTRLLAPPGDAACFAGHPLPCRLRLDAEGQARLRAVEGRLGQPGSVAMKMVLAAFSATEIPVSPAEAGALLSANTPEQWRALNP